MTGTAHEDQYIFFIISRSFRLKMRNILDRFTEKIKTHILCSIIVFESSAVYQILWENIVERPQKTI